MDKVAIFAFRGDPTCFVHVLLNSIDMKEKGIDVRVILEGEAVKLIKEMRETDNRLFGKAFDMGLFDSVCKGCSAKFGVLEYNLGSGIPVNGDMTGHPPMEPYIRQGYSIITL